MTKRNLYIDVLRFVGAFSVLMVHFLPKSMGADSFPFGRTGVVLFFVISGFLIGKILIQHRINVEKRKYTKAQALTDFYLRRVIRIFPLYYGVVMVFVFLQYDPVINNIAWHLTYTSNYGQMLGNRMVNLAHFWSLCVEEQFYLLAPALILWLPVKRLPRVFTGLLVAAVLGKTLLAYQTQSWTITTLGLYGNLEGLLLGIMMGYLGIFGVRHREKIFLICMTVSGWILFGMLQWRRLVYEGEAWYFVNQPYYMAFFDIALSASVAYPILICSEWQPIESRVLKILAYLGKISYGIYVYHYLLIPFMPPWFRSIGIQMKEANESVFSLVLCTLLSIAVAAASWHFYEYQILKLKDRIRVLGA